MNTLLFPHEHDDNPHGRCTTPPEDGLCNARKMLDEAYKMTIAVTKLHQESYNSDSLIQQYR